MKHKRLLIITTCLVFVMVCVVSFKELFSVRDITVVYSVTETSEAEEVLTLLNKYKGEFIFNIDESVISEEITNNRYLKVNSVTKKYPNELIINLSERIEKFYYQATDGIYFFDEEYFVIRKSTTLPSDSEYLIEICFEDINGEKVDASCECKKVFDFPNGLNRDASLVCSVAESISEQISKISFLFTQEEGNYRIRMQTRTGAVIEIRKAGSLLGEKLACGVEYFLALEEARKIDGLVFVQENSKGEISANHTFN